MAKSRKDPRGYALHTGECYRKDGRYSFAYTDKLGYRRTIYSKNLSDLRKREREIIRAIEDGLDPRAPEKISLNQLFDKYISEKYDLRPTTKNNYTYMYNRFVRDNFGKRKIGNIRYSDVKKFYYSLIIDKVMQSNTLDTIHTVLHPTFQMAVRDGLLRINPTEGVMAEIKRSHYWEVKPRHALTIPQQRAFTKFLTENNEYAGWYPVIMVLLGTGMRIGECLALTWDDLDFEKRTISVKKNLTYRPGEDGSCKKHITATKTRAGRRTIPMLDEVYEAFLEEYKTQCIIDYKSETIDGCTDFVFLTFNGNVMGAGSVNQAISNIVKAHNKRELEIAEQEGREPLLIPHISAHNLRHTFCTRLCENETNLKVIQSVMGHADISTTMDIYAEATEEKKQEIVANLQGKIIV